MPAHPFVVNDDPFSEPAFLAGLEAAGYLQRLDTSEARITARYQHALSKMQFALHSEEFLTRAGVKKVHRSTVQFFSEEPTPMDPFIHVLVGSLPPARQALVTPRGCETSGWTPIGSPDEADGTVHFTVSHPGFWPVTVVFDCNQQDIGREDKFAAIGDDFDESDESDPEGYPLGSSRRGRINSSPYASYGAARSDGYVSGASRSSTYDSGRGTPRRPSIFADSATAAGGYASGSYARSAGRSGRAPSRGNSYASYGDSASDSEDDDDAPEDDGRYSGRYGASGSGAGYGGYSNSTAGSRRGSMSAADIDSAMQEMSLSRSNSRASMRRSSSRASRRAYE
ncbi:hypothetical protein JCM3770_003546 [Rhodotorula araucariae]